MSYTFTIPAGMKPGTVVPKDQSRFAMNGMALLPRPTVGDGREDDGASDMLAITDGKVLAILPVAIEGDKPTAPQLLPAISANGKEAHVEVNGEVRTTVGKKTSVSPLPEQEGRYPAIGQVYPFVGGFENGADEMQTGIDFAPLDNAMVVCLDATLLAKLAQAISPQGIVMLFIHPSKEDNGKTPLENKEVSKCISVIGHVDGTITGMGAIMPIAISHPIRMRAQKHLIDTALALPRQSFSFAPLEVKDNAKD